MHLTLSLASLSILLFSCSQAIQSDPIHDYNSFPAASEFLEGVNRFPFGVVASSGTRLVGATIHVSFYHSDNRRSNAYSEAEATYHPIEASTNHFHLDESHHIHSDDLGFYMVRMVHFDKVGVWEARFTVRTSDNKRIKVTPLVFQVKSGSKIPSMGELAPHSNNPTASTTYDLVGITTHPDPNPDLYTTTISDAILGPRPLVVVFSTPAYCTSRLCGPVTDLAYGLHDQYAEVLDVIHIEPFDISTARTEGRLIPTSTLREWGLETEPWLFIIDKDGRVVDRFEGPIPAEYLEASVRSIIE